MSSQVRKIAKTPEHACRQTKDQTVKISDRSSEVSYFELFQTPNTSYKSTAIISYFSRLIKSCARGAKTGLLRYCTSSGDGPEGSTDCPDRGGRVGVPF